VTKDCEQQVLSLADDILNQKTNQNILDLVNLIIECSGD